MSDGLRERIIIGSTSDDRLAFFRKLAHQVHLSRCTLFDAKRRDGWMTYMQGAELRKSWSVSLVQLAMTVGLDAAGNISKSLNHYFQPNQSPYTLDSILTPWCWICRRYHSSGCYR